MKDPKRPIVRPKKGWNTSHGEPNGDQHLNEHRLKVVEKARMANLPHYINQLEKRMATLERQKEKAQGLLDKARKELAALKPVADME